MRSLLVFLVLLVACSAAAREHDRRENGFPAAEKPPEPPTGTLYLRIGPSHVTEVIDTFLANVMADERINTFFKNTDVHRMKKLLEEQICVVAGGKGCAYNGKDMKTAHVGLGIRGEHFSALIEDFSKALDARFIGEPDKSELLDKLRAMRDDVVTP